MRDRLKALIKHWCKHDVGDGTHDVDKIIRLLQTTAYQLFINALFDSSNFSFDKTSS